MADVGSLVPLVGRSAELEILRGLVGDAAGGRTRMAVIEGEPGIGKSRLVTETLGFAERSGCRVVMGTCDQLDRDRPLLAVREALHLERAAPGLSAADLGREQGRAIDALGRLAPAGGFPDEGWLAIETVLDVVEEMASRAPLAMAVEDLQWADPLTLRAVHSIARNETRLPLTLLVTVRQGSQGADVDRVVADLLGRGADHLVLGPLGAQEAIDLAGEIAGMPPGPRLRDQLGGAGGNPLFVIELLRALADEGAIEVSDGRAEANRTTLPPTLRLTILRRLSLLPEDVLNGLRLASILGATFSVGELALVTGQTAAQLLPGLGAAVDGGLLTESGDRLAFRHDLVRDAVYTDLPVAVRKGLHRHAGAVLGAAGAPIERVAGHVALGAEPGDPEAVLWLRRAAHTAAARAPVTAIRLLERALEIIDPGDPQRDALSAELVEPLLSTGRLGDAETVARAVLARSPEPGVDTTVRTALAGVLAMGARYPEAIQQLEEAANAASDQERPSLAAAGSFLMVLAGRVDDARRAAHRAVETAERLGDDHPLCLGLQTLAVVALAEGFVDRAVTLAGRAVTVVHRSDAAWANYLVPELWHGTALSDADRLDEADAVLHAGRLRAERTGNVARLPLYYWAIAEVRLAAGRWDDALAEARTGLGLIEETATQVGDVFANAVCADIAFHRDDPTLAQAGVHEARRRLVAGPLEIGFEWMTWVEALVLEANGRPAEALATLEQTWDLIAPLRYLQAASRSMGPDLVRMAVAAGDQPRAVAVTEELEVSAERSPTPTARGLALRCRGLLDDDPIALLEAVAAHQRGPRPYHLAAAREDAGMALARAARGDEAVPLLTDALAGYQQLDAVRDVTRVHAVLASLGIRRPRRPRRGRPTFGWDSLTPTELQVVVLAARGLTNREIGEQLFVARRTVATHLEHIFQKLGYTNRTELAADAARRAASEPTPPSDPTAPAAGPANPQRRPPAPSQN